MHTHIQHTHTAHTHTHTTQTVIGHYIIISSRNIISVVPNFAQKSGSHYVLASILDTSHFQFYSHPFTWVYAECAITDLHCYAHLVHLSGFSLRSTHAALFMFYATLQSVCCLHHPSCAIQSPACVPDNTENTLQQVDLLDRGIIHNYEKPLFSEDWQNFVPGIIPHIGHSLKDL